MGASPGDVLTFERLRSSKGYYIYVNTAAGGDQRGAERRGGIPHLGRHSAERAKHPDRITLDLDPDPDLPWQPGDGRGDPHARAGRRTESALLSQDHRRQGLHIVFPIERRNTWDESEGVRREHRRVPRARRAGRFTAKIAKQSRGGKIFVDYLRNAETASAVAAYSPRARPGAHVSTPLDWDELDSTDIRGAFTVLNIAQRLRSH